MANGVGSPQKLTELTVATPVGTDRVMFVDDPAGTPSFKLGTIDSVLAVAQTHGKNALDADTGITGDGSTDDSAAIDTLLSAGGLIYFPPATYRCTSTMTVNHADTLGVVCAAGVIFDAGAIDGNLFTFTTPASTPRGFSWYGGVFNVGEMLNSDTSAGRRDEGLNQEGTASNTDVMSFLTGYWSWRSIVGVKMYASQANSGRPDQLDPKDIDHHWMGDKTNSVGADSGIIWNAGTGPMHIEDCLFVGMRDSGIYANGASSATARTVVRNCDFYWCTKGASAKSDLANVLFDGCYAYGCYIGFEGTDASAGAGPTDMQMRDCTVELYQIAYQLDICTRSSLSDCKAIDGGYVDWNNESTHTDGKVLITSDTDGQTITGITVNGVQIMDGTTETQSGTGSAAVKALAQAVRDNINGHTSTPDYLASVREGSTSGQWQIQIQNADAGNDADGYTVARAGTATTTDTAMAYSWATPIALYVQGSQTTNVDGLEVIGTSSPWTTAFSTDRVRVLHIKSAAVGDRSDGGAARQTLDTTIRNLTVDGVNDLYAEVTTSGVSDPDRTSIVGIVMGDDCDDYAAPTMLGASSRYDFQQVHYVTLAADHTLDDTTFDAILQIQTRNGENFITEGYLAFDADTADDLRVKINHDGGTASGRVTWTAQPDTASSTVGGVSTFAVPNETVHDIGGIGTGGGFNVVGVAFRGMYSMPAAGGFGVEVRLKADSSTNDGKVYSDGTYAKFTRI